MKHIYSKDSNMTHQEALGYAGGIVGLNALSALVINQFFIGGFHNGMKVRVAVCSIIYRKVSDITFKKPTNVLKIYSIIRPFACHKPLSVKQPLAKS